LTSNGYLEIWLEKEPDATNEQEVREDARAKAAILLQVSGPFILRVDRATTAKAAWDTFKEDYITSMAIRKQTLMRERTSLKQGRQIAQQYVERAKAVR
jgi:hypothetical protein